MLSAEPARSNSVEERTWLSWIISRFSFGISIPITVLPGITSTTRTEITAKDLARSLTKLLIRLTFTPGAGWTSKRVITGPGLTAITPMSIPKSLSLSSRSLDIADSDSSENPDLFVSCHASSNPIAGSSCTEVALNNRP